jgi:hypothetical protein
MAPRLASGFHVPLGRGGNVPRGGRALLMIPQGLGRGKEMSPEMPIMPEASPHGSGEIEFVVCALSG